MHLLTLLAVAAGALGAARARVQPPTDPSDTPPATQPAGDALKAVEPPPEALALLKGLDDPDYARREQAETNLFGLILSNPALEQWLAGASRGDPSPEVRARSANILAKLAEHRLLGATLVSLDVKNVHPRQLVAELAEQSGVRFDYSPPDPWEQGGASDNKVSLQLSNVPFWEAMRRVSELTSLVPVEHQQASAGAIVLSPHGESLGVAPTLHHGAFALQLRRIYRHQTAHIELGVGPDGAIAGNSNSDSNLQVELRMLVEPKIRLTGNASQPILDEVVDENGNNLLPQQDPRMDGSRGWSNSASAWSVQASIMLDSKAAARSQRIARLKGRMEVEIATDHESLQIKVDDLVDLRRLKEGEKKDLARRFEIGVYKIELNSVQKASDQSIQFEVSASWDQGGNDAQNGWMRAQALMNSLRLEDASGRPWASAGGGSGWDGTVMKSTRTFYRPSDEAGTPARLVLEVPTRVMSVSIPFEFTDVPLPQWD